MTTSNQSIDREKIARYREKIARDPHSLEHLREAVEYFLQVGLCGEALPPLERLIALQPDDHSLHLLRGAIYIELGRIADAENEFLDVADRDPRSTSAYHNLGLIYCATNQPDKAIQQFLRILQLEPGNHETLNDLAVLYALTGQSENARKTFDRCLNTGSDYRKGLENALDFALSDGRLGWGRQWITRWKARFPDDSVISDWEAKFDRAAPATVTHESDRESASELATGLPACPDIPEEGATVSVVLPVFNEAKSIVNILHSLFRQTHQSLEIIIIDDGSTDDTEEVLSAYESKITYVRRIHQGWAAAVNEGIQISSGKYILPISSGDILRQDIIENQVSFLAANPGTDISPVGSTGNISRADIPMFRREAFGRYGFFDEAADDDSGEWSRTLMAAKAAYPDGNAGADVLPSGQAEISGNALGEYRSRILDRWTAEVRTPEHNTIPGEAPALRTARRTGLSLVIIGAEDIGGMFSSLASAINNYTPHRCEILTHKVGSNRPTEEIRELADGADWLIFVSGIAPGAVRRDRRLEDTIEVPFGEVDWSDYTHRKKCAAFLGSSPSVRGNYQWYDKRFRDRGWPVLTSSVDVCLNVPDARYVPPVLHLAAPEYTRPDFAVGPMVVVYPDRPAYAADHTDMLVPAATEIQKKHGDGVSFGRYTEITQRESLVFRHHAHVGLDRLSFGAPRFGLTSLENSALGLVNIVYLDPFVRSVLSRALGTEELPWYSPDSVDALYEIIDRLAAEPVELQKQMQNTAAWFRRWWAEERIVQRFTAVIESL